MHLGNNRANSMLVLGRSKPAATWSIQQPQPSVATVSTASAISSHNRSTQTSAYDGKLSESSSPSAFQYRSNFHSLLVVSHSCIRH